MTPGAPSAVLLWIITHGCISEIEPMPYANTVNVFKSDCPVPGPMVQAAPTPRPVIVKAKPKAKAKRKRSSACGSRRQVWRTLPGGHRKFRCIR